MTLRSGELIRSMDGVFRDEIRSRACLDEQLDSSLVLQITGVFRRVVGQLSLMFTSISLSLWTGGCPFDVHCLMSWGCTSIGFHSCNKSSSAHNLRALW